MQTNTWNNYRTAPLLLKFFAWITILGTLFFVFHSIILIIFSKTLEPAAWIQEIYFNSFCVLPIFLLFTGTFITEKKYRIPLWLFLGIFAVGHAINMLNTYEIVDIGRLQYPMSVALLGLFITYLIHFIKKQKNVLDFLKIAWFAFVMWVYIAPRFIQSGHKAGWFLIAAQLIFPVMMAIGMYHFFRKPKTENIA
ncbi:MAG TPA: hypothetical protein VK826_08415 [Bacteroidia bacterium]|nr:hypothetical protein [Bacteroidia bacterium]